MQRFGCTPGANRDLPVSSRAAHQRWVDHCYELHRSRLREVGPRIDHTWQGNKGKAGPRPTYAHLRFNAKRAQREGELQAERELENYVLLSKLSKYGVAQAGRTPRSRPHRARRPWCASCRILQREPLEVRNNPYVGIHAQPSTTSKGKRQGLNSASRQQELRKIHEDNLRLVHRIQARKPSIRARDHQRDYEQSQRYKAMISLFSRTRVTQGSVIVPSPSRVHADPPSGSVSARGDRKPPGPHGRTRPRSANASLMRKPFDMGDQTRQGTATGAFESRLGTVEDVGEVEEAEAPGPGPSTRAPATAADIGQRR